MLGFYKGKLCHIQAGISHVNENIIKEVLLTLGTLTFITISNMPNL